MFHGFGFGIFGCLWAAMVLALVVFPLWRICEKMGYPGPVSLLMFLPVVNIVMVWVLAMSEWPIERERRALRGQPAPGAPIGG